MSFKPKEVGGGISFCQKKNRFKVKVWARNQSCILNYVHTMAEAQFILDMARCLLTGKEQPFSAFFSAEQIKQFQMSVMKKLEEVNLFVRDK